jgi:Zn-dependent protease
MIGEVDIYGVLFPPLLVWLGCAYLIGLAVRAVFNRLGVYRYVWHRPLFDLAILLILLGGVAALANRLF